MVVKKQRSSSVGHANDAIKKPLNQAKLDNPNACKIYDCYLNPGCRDGFKSVIVMEWMERDGHCRLTPSTALPFGFSLLHTSSPQSCSPSCSVRQHQRPPEALYFLAGLRNLAVHE